MDQPQPARRDSARGGPLPDQGRAVPTHLAGEGLSADTGPVLGAGAFQRPVRRVRGDSRSAGQALGRAVGHRSRVAQGEAAAGRAGPVGPLAAGTRLCGSRASLGARARAHWAGCQGVFCGGARAADLRARGFDVELSRNERHIYHWRSARFRPRARRRLPRGRPRAVRLVRPRHRRTARAAVGRRVHGGR